MAWIDATIEANVGPMRAGKTENAMSRLRHLMRMQQFGKGVRFVFIRPKLDNRQADPTRIENHDGVPLEGVKAIIIDHKQPTLILDDPQVSQAQVVIIDEVQFFDRTICSVLLKLYLARKHILVFGVDTDHLGRAFRTTADILGLPETQVRKLDTAICEEDCQRTATRTIRIIAGHPDAKESRQFVVEGKGATYRSVCLQCFIRIMTEAGIPIH